MTIVPATLAGDPPHVTPQPPKHQLVVGTALAVLAGSTLIGSMLAVWALMRQRVLAAEEEFLGDYVITEVATNVMLITVWALVFFSAWAFVSGKRQDRAHTALALGLCGLFGLAFVNAQAFVWGDMEVPIDETSYGALYYAITGTMTALAIVGILYSIVAAFRALSGRLEETEVLVGHSLYWFFTAAAYSAVWFLVYVTK